MSQPVATSPLNRRYWLLYLSIGLVTATSVVLISRHQHLARLKVLGGQVHSVNLVGDHAEPSLIGVKVGEAVQFNARDGRHHNIGQGRGDEQLHSSDRTPDHEHTKGGIQSGTFKPDEGYRVKFSQPGRYDFHDHLHPKISVTILVYDPARPAPSIK